MHIVIIIRLGFATLAYCEMRQNIFEKRELRKEAFIIELFNWWVIGEGGLSERSYFF